MLETYWKRRDEIRFFQCGYTSCFERIHWFRRSTICQVLRNVLLISLLYYPWQWSITLKKLCPILLKRLKPMTENHPSTWCACIKTRDGWWRQNTVVLFKYCANRARAKLPFLTMIPTRPGLVVIYDSPFCLDHFERVFLPVNRQQLPFDCDWLW
jgi:hypothetical protein